MQVQNLSLHKTEALKLLVFDVEQQVVVRQIAKDSDLWQNLLSLQATSQGGT